MIVAVQRIEGGRGRGVKGDERERENERTFHGGGRGGQKSREEGGSLGEARNEDEAKKVRERASEYARVGRAKRSKDHRARRARKGLSLVADKPLEKQGGFSRARCRRNREATKPEEGESVSVLLAASMPPGLYTTFNDNTFLRSLSGHYCRPLKIPSQHLFGK